MKNQMKIENTCALCLKRRTVNHFPSINHRRLFIVMITTVETINEIGNIIRERNIDNKSIGVNTFSRNTVTRNLFITKRLKHISFIAVR